MPPVQLRADEIGHVDVVDRDIAQVTRDADVHQAAVPDRDTGQVAVGEPGSAHIGNIEPGSPELLAAAALTRVEPVRPELRLHRFIG